MSERPLRVNVYEFLNYREFLRAAYTDLKERQNGFSYRWFSRKCGMKSPNFLKLVIQAERNLTTDSAGRFAHALSLDAKETEFFLELVAFQQASTSERKNVHYARIGTFRKHKAVSRLERRAFEYLSRWYYPAIRELVTCSGFREDSTWIAMQLQPPLTPREVEKAITVLLELAVLERSADGVLRQGEALLSTGPEVRSLAVGNFHRQMMERAADSIEAVHRDDREISGVTVALSLDRFRQFKAKIQQLRAELLELSADETEATRVVQFNFQAFPLASTETSES